jgi:hypothetical protein
MMKIEKRQYIAFAVLATIILWLTYTVNRSNSPYFQKFIGTLNPFIALLGSAIVGALLLAFSLHKEWFKILKKENLKDWFTFFGWVSLFATVVILVDWKIVFPKDMNVPFPESLLFYPVMAFFVEILFHVLPLSLLLLLLTSVFKTINNLTVFSICIFIVVMLEPTYQIQFIDNYPLWSIITVWVNLFIFNLAQLIIFRRYDFVSMYVFRLFYYFIWHITWGHYRLILLF